MKLTILLTSNIYNHKRTHVFIILLKLLLTYIKALTVENLLIYQAKASLEYNLM